VYDRWYLLGERRTDTLALDEVQQYGQDTFGNPDHVSIYGLRPDEWYARDIRLLGRTAVECTPDPLGRLIGRDIARVGRHAPAIAVDLFAGSGNTLYWIKQCTGVRRAVGFELDDAVFALSARNLALADVDIELIHDGYESGLRALGEPHEDLVIVFVAPPWGRAFDERSGLDLRRMRPPVAEVLDVVIDRLGSRQLLFAVQIHETVDPESLAEVTARFPWTTTTVYDLNAPGQHPGLLLASSTMQEQFPRIRDADLA
jgi:16S rRNA G966 N2-methylase RsmD